MDDELTMQQRSMLQMSWDGLSVKDTARQMGLSEKTVKNYRAVIFQKLRVNCVEGMLRQGVERGLIGPSGVVFDNRRSLMEWPGCVEA